MPKGKHLTLDDRRSIQIGLHEGLTFRQIAQNIGKDPSTISKEVRSHMITSRTASCNPCRHVRDCHHYNDICSPCREQLGRSCRGCPSVTCCTVCPEFVPKICRRLSSAPYVCNGCPDRHGCRLERHLYPSRKSSTPLTALWGVNRSENCSL